MKTLHAWPAKLSSPLEGLYQGVADHLGAEVETLSSLTEAGSGQPIGTTSTVLLVPEAAVLAGTASPVEVATRLPALEANGVRNLLVVVGDGYLGTDIGDLAASNTAAAAVNTVRSLAVRRNGQIRANAVCIPDRLFGKAGSQRAPMRIASDVSDVVNAASFLLDEAGAYLNGQVLFVDGGRHLFSSMSA